jgi:hypothetical protein
MRPFEMLEANTIIPNGLSIKSGSRDPTARYLGSMVVFNRGAKYENMKNIPSVIPMCPKISIIKRTTLYLYINIDSLLH